ncbi:hypothetical protein F2Q69_00002327 [Brassica cretica]|uniref:G-box binding protein multifunctional mosaic region domain-containing protein n=1 Tax=Brassica cretica TaxID=69181 RepID=A0A8S9PKY7_BRACR|nr:hypothetical protein F2Q69_00002327 [Brassica cretica]
MWNSQHMMSPYGTPYAAVYPHGGGVSAHPGFPMRSQPQVQKGPPLTTVSGIASFRFIVDCLMVFLTLLYGVFVNGSRGRL